MDRRPSPRGAGAWPDRPVERAVFASDLHLHRADPAGVARAVAFLEHVRAGGADALFLLGDVFRAWIGAGSLRDDGLAPFLSGLSGLAGAGVRVVLLHGNHDFMLGDEAPAALGVEVAGCKLDVALAGQRVRLLHGDALCTLDRGYQRLHRVLRSAPVRALARALPAAAARALADAIMAGSGHATAAKTRREMDIVDEAALEHFAAGADALVCGHVHYARDAELTSAAGVRGRLVVLPDFERSGGHATWDRGRLELLREHAAFARPIGPVVAIDGPAGSGKSSVSRRLAERLGWGRLDSGALYRAVTARALAVGAAPRTPPLAALAAGLRLESLADGGVAVDGLVVPDDVLRGPEVSAHVSAISGDPEVRSLLLPVQHAAGRRGPGLVAEGRDMASVVFPEATLAVYLDARPEVRAARRAAQNAGEGGRPSEVEQALRRRDQRDSTREHAPLVRAASAVVVDTSDLSLEQTVERIEALLAERRRVVR